MYSHPWMKRILTAVVLVALVIPLVFLGPDWLVSLAVGAVALLAAWEYIGIAEATGAKPPRIAILVAIGVLFTVNQVWPDRLAITLGALGLGLLVYCTFAGPVERALQNSAAAVFCLIYTGFTLTALPNLRSAEDGKSLVLFLLCVVWAGDIAAMYIGRSLGKLKLAPKLSPGKTWEGAIASIAGSLLVTAGLIALALQLGKREILVIAYPGPVWHWLLLAAAVNVAAQVGDLAESALKRSAGVKDSGTILPGHGGVLDRIDALLLAAPVLWYAQIVQHF